MKKILVVVVMLMLCLPIEGKSQLSSDGKDFYVGLLYPSFMSQNIGSYRRNVQGFYGVYLLISSYYDNVVTISYFDDAGKEGFQQTFKVAARRSIQVPLDITHTKMYDPGEMPEFKSCHITSPKPISIQYFSTGACAGGSYLALPTSILGKSYVVESYHDNTGGVGGLFTNENSAGYFMVIGAYDGTTVEITPATTTAKGKPGVNSGPGSNGIRHPFTIGLNRGQCYMVKSTGGDSSFDISGTTVKGNKPIAVIAGHENASVQGGSVDTLPLEARDYMVEQMIPTEYWDTTGYVSIPFIDSRSPYSGGEGDEYKFFGLSDKVDSVVINSNIKQNVKLSAGAFKNPVPSQVGIISPVNAYTSNRGKFHVMMYDRRMQGGGQPFPAPSMMSIVPQSRWKSSYLWYVPNNTFEILQGYYINMICRRVDYDHDSIQLAVNGGKLASVRAAGVSIKKLWGNIPDHPELVGITYAIGPGAYYITNIAKGGDNLGKVGFMIYNYGFRAIDPDRSLGALDSLEHYFSYAAPCGFSSGRIDTSTISVTVDTLCAQWNICVHTRGTNKPSIRYLNILDDPNGDIIRPGRKYYNTQFDPAVDPTDQREVSLFGNDSDYCVKIKVKNPLDTGYCPLYITDNNGNSYLVDLRYKSPKLRVFFSPTSLQNGFDSVIYSPTAVGDQRCATLYYVNSGDSAKGDLDVQINAVSLKNGNGTFAITGVAPSIPVTLKPRSKSKLGGDTIAVTVCFNSKDTALHLDSLMLETSCFKAPMTLVGQGGIGKIYANDHNFGSVLIGESRCDTVSIKNVGNLPFTLTKNWILHNLTEFAMTPSSSDRLPKILNPGDTIQLRFCFGPNTVGTDSSSIDWVTDIQKPYDNQIKSWSYLKGTGIRPGVIWGDSIVKIYADTSPFPMTGSRRVFIINNSTTKTYVTKVFIEGQDASEFKNIANQLGYNPLEQFQLSSKDSFWVEIQFEPDFSKPIAVRRLNRHARLVANFNRNVSGTITDSTIAELLGVFDSTLLGVRSTNQQSDGATLGAYQYDRQLILLPSDMPNDKFTCELYDLLGRKVMSWDNTSSQIGQEEIAMPLPRLSSGVYVVRLKFGAKQLVARVMIGD